MKQMLDRWLKQENKAKTRTEERAEEPALPINQTILGDCLEVLKTFPDNYFDSVVTDPPYGLEFMGKEWDKDVVSAEYWEEILRVLKPGAHLLSFFGSRTYHKGVTEIEDAGFEIRDMIAWIYGSGFPKSLDIGKAIDKHWKPNYEWIEELENFGEYLKQKRLEKGLSKEEIDSLLGTNTAYSWWEGRKSGVQLPDKEHYEQLKKVLDLDDRFDDLIENKQKRWVEADREIIGKDGRKAEFSMFNIGVQDQWDITSPKTKEAEEWDGWGTALKPSIEPICLARKPIAEKNVAQNVLKWRTGGLNINAGRIEGDVDKPFGRRKNEVLRTGYSKYDSDKGIGFDKEDWNPHTQGRFPANTILDPQTAQQLDKQSGESFSDGGDGSKFSSSIFGLYGEAVKTEGGKGYGDVGGASRFFYIAKAGRGERYGYCKTCEKVIPQENWENKPNPETGKNVITCPNCKAQESAVFHVTVKPLDLMKYLVRLVTPKNGIVLDPFIGSGTTGIACLTQGFNFVGIEIDPVYYKIALHRLKPHLEQKKLEVFMT